MKTALNKAFWLFSGLIVFTVLIGGCKIGTTEAQKQELLDTVKEYNSLLRLAYLEVNENHLKGITTEDQFNKIYPTFLTLRLEDSYMRAEQKTFKVEAVRIIAKDMGQVDTKEKWVFWWQRHKTNEVTKPRSEVFYHMRYDLVKQNGVWKVNKLEDLEEDSQTTKLK